MLTLGTSGKITIINRKRGKKKEIHRCFWMAHNEVGMTLKACQGTSGRMGISFFYITKYVFESQMINVDSTLDG